MDASNSGGLEVPQAHFPGLLGRPLQEAVQRAIPWYIEALLRTYPSCFISGGFIRDAAVRLPYHDIDIYLNGADPDRVCGWLQQMQPDSNIVKRTDRGITVDCNITNYNTDGTAILWEMRPVQLLLSSNVDVTVEGFDLSNCTATYNFHKGLIYSSRFSAAIMGGMCFVNPSGINPRTYYRMGRMRMQGWKFLKEDEWAAYNCQAAAGRDSG